MVIRLGVWTIDGKSGNWLQAVESGKPATTNKQEESNKEEKKPQKNEEKEETVIEEDLPF
jgi:hypothetical protein